MKRTNRSFMKALVAIGVELSKICLLFAFSQSAAAQSNTAHGARSGPRAMTLDAHFGQSGNPHINKYANLLAASVWPNRKVYVCWDNPSKKYSTEMDLVRQSVADTWEKYSGLTFAGWGLCARNNQGIRITIADEGPYTRGLGKYVQFDPMGSRPGGMVLNFEFQNWSPQCRDASMRSTCIRSIAIHEFGHAIGFAHEQNRPDTPGECALRRQGPDGDIMLTPYDKESRMNYCFNIYTPNLTLSNLDIDAVRYVYGSGLEKTVKSKE